MPREVSFKYIREKLKKSPTCTTSTLFKVFSWICVRLPQMIKYSLSFFVAKFTLMSWRRENMIVNTCRDKNEQKHIVRVYIVSNTLSGKGAEQKTHKHKKYYNTFSTCECEYCGVIVFKSRFNVLHARNRRNNSELTACQRSQTHLRAAIRSRKDGTTNQRPH